MRMGSRGRYILVGVWCLMAVVLANAYAGTLFSFLSVAKLEPIVNSLEALAQSKDLQLIVQDRSEMAKRFMVMTTSFFLRNISSTFFNHILYRVQHAEQRN